MNEKEKSNEFWSKLSADSTYNYWQSQAIGGRNEARRRIGYRRQYQQYWKIYNSVQGSGPVTSSRKGLR